MKTTTKLLLGATVVAGLNISAFAACAADIDMGNKQLKNVANGVDDGDAVNYGQTLKKTTQTLTFTPDTNITAQGNSVISVTRMGNMCSLVTTLQTVGPVASGAIITELPTGFKPITHHFFRMQRATGGDVFPLQLAPSGFFQMGEAPIPTTINYMRVSVNYLCQ